MKQLASFAVLVIAVGMTGCDTKTTVAGAATYNGAAIEQGYVTFSPQGAGTSFGAPIANGRYAVEEGRPGDYTATIIGTRKLNHYSTSAEAYANAPKSGAHVAEAADYIDANAEGNGIECKIAAGDQTLDFAVTGKPAPK